MVVSLMDKIRSLFARFETDGEYVSPDLFKDVRRAIEDEDERVTIERKVEFDAGFERMRIAAYRVKYPETGLRSKLQFHFTHGPTVLAVLGESAAKLFANFVFDTLGDQRCISDVAREVREGNSPGHFDPMFPPYTGATADISEAPGPLQARLNRIVSIIESVDRRVMASDGPILPGSSRKEMSDNELIEIYQLANGTADPRDRPFRGHSDNSPPVRPQTDAERAAMLANLPED